MWNKWIWRIALMKKRLLSAIICLGVLVVMIFSLGACGRNYEYKEEDFSLTITVDKTEAKVGDTITVTATLENLSGRNIHIRKKPSDRRKLKDMIAIGFFPESEEYYWSTNPVSGLSNRITIKKDTVIILTKEFIIEESENYVTDAVIIFFVGKGYKTDVWVYSEPIKIEIKE